MSTFAVTEQQAELVRLAWHANNQPTVPPPTTPDGEAFGRLRAALRGRDLTAARRALDELTEATR